MLPAGNRREFFVILKSIVWHVSSRSTCRWDKDWQGSLGLR